MNALKGWVTSVFGLIIMIVDALYFFGFIHLPNPQSLQKPSEVGVAFGIGLVLFLMPPTWIEEQIKKYIDKKQAK